MKQVSQSFITLVAIFLGFVFAFVGVVKIDHLHAAEKSIKESITFGDANSPIEIYIFTDWACPACRHTEPAIVSMMPSVTKQARVTFVDFVIHADTLNYIPYNLSFMLHNKSQYLKIRDALTALSEETGTPTEEQVEKAIAPLGVTYRQLNFADVEMGNKYFKHLGDEFEIDSTPTMVIVNAQAKKGKKLFGPSEITQENVLKAIETLKKPAAK